jgi:hypothetical protein
MLRIFSNVVVNSDHHWYIAGGLRYVTSHISEEISTHEKNQEGMCISCPYGKEISREALITAFASCLFDMARYRNSLNQEMEISVLDHVWVQAYLFLCLTSQ